MLHTFARDHNRRLTDISRRVVDGVTDDFAPAADQDRANT